MERQRPPAEPSTGPSTADLQGVRAELRRMGYLHPGLGRYLLQDALKPRRPGRALLALTTKVALAAGGLLAAVTSLALAAANGIFAESPFDLIPLFFHLLLPAVLTAGGLFLLLSGVLILALRLYHVRRIEVAAFAVALVAGLGAVGTAVWFSSELWSGLSALGKVSLAAALLVMAAALVKVVESGLLGLAIRLTDQAPRQRLFSLRWLVGGLLVSLALLLLPAVLAVRRPAAAMPFQLAQVEGDRVLLIGVDGVLAQEAEYLLASGELPRLTRLLSTAASWRYSRSTELPATFWTTVATGRRGEDHGVVALDAFQPLGVRTPLARNGPLRGYWRRIAEPFGLAGHRPVLAARRRVPTIWELASRGGKPVVSVNWWGTYPAEPLPGLVVAHGAFGLLQGGAPGALASQSRQDLVRGVEGLARRQGPDPGSEPAAVSLPAGLEAALGVPAATEILQRSVLPDRFYGEALAASLVASPVAAAIYLPAPDLAASDWRGGAVALGDLVRSSLRQVEGILERTSGDFDAFALVLDPGRRGPREGRIYLHSPAVCPPSAREPGALPATLRPQELTAGLLRLLGLPQSRELPLPPAGCSWPEPPDIVPTYGPRELPPPPPRSGDAYLKNLRSLGYL